MYEESEAAARRKFIPNAHELLAGQSPKARHLQKMIDVLLWVYEHGQSTSGLLQRVSGARSGAFASSLVDKGLLAATRVEGAGFVQGVPLAVYTLTGRGLEEAERHVRVPMRYEINTAKIIPRLLRHNFVAQQVTLDVFDRLAFDRYYSDRRLALRNAGKRKRPDVVWLFPDESRIGVEIELSQKWDRDLDDFVHGMIDLLQEEDLRLRVDHFLIFCDSSALRENYKRAILPGAPLRTWQKNQAGRWIEAKVEGVPDWLSKRVTVHLLSEWESRYRAK